LRDCRGLETGECRHRREMSPLYLTEQWALIVYWTLLSLWVLSELLVFATHVSGSAERGQDRFSGVALVAGVLLAISLGSRLARDVPGAAIEPGTLAVFWVGMLIGLAGIALRWYAIRSLGRFFRMRVMTVPDQVVIESGPYALVRHPSYTGALMTVLGVILCSTNWLAVACFLIALPGFAYRIGVEERALVGALGDPYRDYMRRTKRLIPYLL
jgi:protein-S-isoprenylcysteine O-methyltransferase Ste14